MSSVTNDVLIDDNLQELHSRRQEESSPRTPRSVRHNMQGLPDSSPVGGNTLTRDGPMYGSVNVPPDILPRYIFILIS